MSGIETVGQLIEALQQHDPAAPVLLAVQPEWPLEGSISAVAAAGGTVYIGEGRQVGYLSAEAEYALAQAVRPRRPRP